MNSFSRAKKKKRKTIPFSYPYVENEYPEFAHEALTIYNKRNLNFPLNRRIDIGIVTLAITIGFFASMIPSFAQQSLDMWVSNWRVQVFKDTTKPSSAATSIQLVVARNETEASQIVLRETSGFTINSVVSSNLTAAGATLSSSNFTYHFLEYFHADKNSGGSQWCDGTMADPIRRAPADFPEQLSNDTIRQVAANTTQSIWVKYRIPTDTPVGTYTGTITVTTSIGTLQVPVSIEVNPAVLPDPKDGTFTSEVWMFPHTIRAVLGPADFSAEWWKIVGDFAKLARETRINSVEGRVSYLVRGNDWTNYDRYIQTFIDTGGLKKITTETMNDGATQYAAQIESHLRSKGWWDMFYMKIIDEPTNVSAYVSLSNSVKAISPSMKIGDPGITNPGGYGLSVNIWQPHITYQGGYDANAGAYASIKQVPGDEVWVYTACFPTQGQLNRLIDNRVFLQELFGWYTFSRDLKGFLHWGLNAWERYPNEGQYQFVGSLGDAWSVYPDTAQGTIMSSIRVESAREMSEDHELFRLLEKTSPTLAKTIVTSIIRSPSDYEKDINKIQTARDQLVRAASGSGGAPDTTGPSVPTGPTATRVSSSQINFSWNASTDNVGVSGYRIHRNGAQIATSGATSYSDTGLAVNTRYNYTVSAYDAAGNASPQSNSVSAMTQAVAASASTYYDSNNQPQYAFDRSVTNQLGWGSDNTLPQWLAYNYSSGGGKVITAYTIYCASNQLGGWNSEAYNPKTWTLQGWNGESWVTLQFIADGALTMNAGKTFSFVNTVAYEQYRINISANEGGTGEKYVHITELTLSNPSGDAQAPSVPTGLRRQQYPAVRKFELERVDGQH